MPQPLKHAVCTRCGAKQDDGVWISTRGKCAPCGELAHRENTVSIATREGEYYEKWLAGIERAAAARRQQMGSETGGVCDTSTAQRQAS